MLDGSVRIDLGCWRGFVGSGGPVGVSGTEDGNERNGERNDGKNAHLVIRWEGKGEGGMSRGEEGNAKRTPIFVRSLSILYSSVAFQ